MSQNMRTKSQSEAVKRNEDLRRNLQEHVRDVGKTGKSIAFGSHPERPPYELVPLSRISERPHRATRVSIDEARKAWSDLRAAVRLFDLEFIITIDGKDCAAVRRHPKSDRSRARLNRWLDGRGLKLPQADLEDRIRRLESEVAELRSFVTK